MIPLYYAVHKISQVNQFGFKENPAFNLKFFLHFNFKNESGLGICNFK